MTKDMKDNKDEACCGSCEWFADEDAWGIGTCTKDNELAIANYRCFDYERRKGDEKESE